MAGPIKTLGKLFGLVAKTTDMATDVVETGKVYTNNMKEVAEENCALDRELSRAKNEVKKIKINNKIDKLKAKIEEEKKA